MEWVFFTELGGIFDDAFQQHPVYSNESANIGADLDTAITASSTNSCSSSFSLRPVKIEMDFEKLRNTISKLKLFLENNKKKQSKLN